MTKKSYKKYKNSGVEWLGKIPENWEIIPFKYNYCFSMGQTILANDLEDNGTIPVISAKEEKSYFGYISNPQFILEKGDFVIPARGTIGAIKMITRPSVCTQTTIYAKKNQSFLKLNDRFIFFYQIGCRNNLFQFDKTAIPQITVEQVKNNPVLLPPLQEQKAIADFLDKETLRLDFLIQKKQKQIELLKEKRSVLITQVVTKGLNPNTKMKDSGVEWLGEIPQHWKLKKLKYISNSNPSNVDKKSKEGEKDVFLCNYVDVYKNEYINDTFNFMKATATIEQISKFILKKGDVIVTKDSEVCNDIAVPALVTKNFNNVVCGYHLTHIKPKKILGEYLFRCFQSKWLQFYFEISANGITRYGINVDKFNSALVLIPNEEEQKAIADFLNKETFRIDSLIEKVKKSIELLKEYRSALITSAVTGQIDVRKSQTKGITAQKTEGKILPIKVAMLTHKKTSRFVRTATPKRGSQNLIFKKAVLGAEIVTRLKDDPHFGRTKFMKTLYLCESHLQIPLKGIYKREAAGPLDSSIYKMEGIMKKNKWFKVVKKGVMFKYQPLKNSTNYKPYFDKYWGGYEKKLNQLLSIVKKFTTEQSEIVDTIYAVWNDFLLEGKKPSDNKIIYEVKNKWHKNKKRFLDSRLQKAIYWMRKENLVPKGYGSKTIRGKI